MRSVDVPASVRRVYGVVSLSFIARCKFFSVTRRGYLMNLRVEWTDECDDARAVPCRAVEGGYSNYAVRMT